LLVLYANADALTTKVRELLMLENERKADTIVITQLSPKYIKEILCKQQFSLDGCKSNVHISASFVQGVLSVLWGTGVVWGHGQFSVRSTLAGEPMIARLCRSSICGQPTVGVTRCGFTVLRVIGVGRRAMIASSCRSSICGHPTFVVAWVRNLGSPSD